jgi:hypothetical protein
MLMSCLVKFSPIIVNRSPTSWPNLVFTLVGFGSPPLAQGLIVINQNISKSSISRLLVSSSDTKEQEEDLELIQDNVCGRACTRAST